MDEQWTIWMRQAQSGDKIAYEQLLYAVRPWLGGFFSKRIHQSFVDDLVQETLMTLHEKRHTYDPSYPFLPWLSVVAKHRWIDHLRKTARRMEVEFNNEIIVYEFDSDTTANQDVIKMLKKIPPAQAEIIDLVKLKEMTIEQAAKKTGHSVSSVKVMIHRGLKKLMAQAQEDRNNGF